MPEDMSQERKMMLSAYGAEVVLTPKETQMQGSINKAQELLDSIEFSFSPRQFDNKSNPEIHKKTTALEILQQMDSKIDAFIAGVGTGGTISGVGTILKSKIPDVRIIAVEPEECATISEGISNPHQIQGIGAGFIPKTLDEESFDTVYKVKGSDAVKMTKILSKKHGIFVGISAGANIFASIEISKKMLPGSKIVTILCDTGERYLSTGIFS